MGSLDGRVIVVTGSGRGLGREYALLLAAEGADVVVNDLGCTSDGTGADGRTAAAVADEIVASGGRAVSSSDNVATMDGAARLLELALTTFGTVHGLVNNAGILRDRMFVNMTEDDWDAVIRGQLKATFCPGRAFAGHWRTRAKEGDRVAASIVNVSSTSGLIGAAGQANYGAAKAGVAALTVIMAKELQRYGIRVNAITPVARTRMTQDVPGIGEMMREPADPQAFDVYHPGNVSPLVAWLLTLGCPASGQVFYAKGGEVRQFLGWRFGESIERSSRWTVDELAKEMQRLG